MGLLQQDGTVVFQVKLPTVVHETTVPTLERPHDLIRPWAEVERKAIESAMILCAGNLTLASQKLGLSRTGLRQKLNGYRVQDGESPLPDRRIKAMAATAGVG
jgi:DNA-binding NtrC family response regulator